MGNRVAPQRNRQGRVIGTGRTAVESTKETRKQKKADAHAPWKAKYKKETGKDASGLKGQAGYNEWLRKQRAARAKKKSASGGIAAVAGKAKGKK